VAPRRDLRPWPWTEPIAPPDLDPFAELIFAAGIIAPQQERPSTGPAKRGARCIIRAPASSDLRSTASLAARPTHSTALATEKELSDFLKSVEKRAFKRASYHVREAESALDIVQDSMLKLSQHYGDRPVTEFPMLFQRILSNTTMDWFRRNKTRNALFSNLSDFEGADPDGDFDILETLSASSDSEAHESAEDSTSRAQTLQQIELAIQELPGRQREAFLMRYWEEMDVAETAAAMGCTEGSVKTHCSRAVHALSKMLRAKGIRL
jgi:RNA polymerase sigma-70 factor, ECF subfamily